jgi:hypothetical protein
MKNSFFAIANDLTQAIQLPFSYRKLNIPKFTCPETSLICVEIVIKFGPFFTDKKVLQTIICRLFLGKFFDDLMHPIPNNKIISVIYKCLFTF